MKPGEMPAGWRSAGGVYKLQYTHPLCENSLAMVVGVCMGPVLVINGEFVNLISRSRCVIGLLNRKVSSSCSDSEGERNGRHGPQTVSESIQLRDRRLARRKCSGCFQRPEQAVQDLQRPAGVPADRCRQRSDGSAGGVRSGCSSSGAPPPSRPPAGRRLCGPTVFGLQTLQRRHRRLDAVETPVPPRLQRFRSQQSQRHGLEGALQTVL